MAPTRSYHLAVAQLSSFANLLRNYPLPFQIFHRSSHILSLCNFLIRSYQSSISSLLDKHAPIAKKLSRRQSPSNPWFSTTLCAFRSTLRHTENIWKRTHSAADWYSFKSLLNQYHKLILSSKKEYYSSLVSSVFLLL